MTEEQEWTVVTGSTGGIGGEIAKQLASRGDALVLVNRSQEKSELQRHEILSSHPNAIIENVYADLMDAKQIQAACKLISELPGRVDALYNNAGILTAEMKLNAQKIESQFAVNVLASYLFIEGLRDAMARDQSESSAMIVNFSSSAIQSPNVLELTKLARPDSVGGLMTTYAQTKLAATALAPALAEGLKAQNILIRAIDPGATKTAMTTGPDTSGMPWIIAFLAPLLFAPANKQAKKVIESAAPSALDGKTGIYVANRKEKKLPFSINRDTVQSDLLELLSRLSSEALA
ncbi:MAG: SDR family NAD(P)-dependent oxidoreductase [Pseudomonadota bacterium]